MSDFQTMDDFAVFVNDYLTPDQLKVQAYSYASDQQELSLLVTVDDYEMMCRWHAVWTFSGLHQAFFQSVMDLDNSFSIDSDSLAMKVRLRDQELLFQAKGLEMVVVDLPEPVDPKTAECRVTNASSESLTVMLSELDRVPIAIWSRPSVP